MRAAVLTAHGGPEVVAVRDDLPVPEPGRDEVRVRIHAAALNRLDLFVRQGWPGLNLDFPHVIAADGAGVIDAVGADVSGWQAGDRVCIDATIVPSDSPYLYTGRENLGPHAILGEHVPGVAAEYSVVPARNLHALPDHVDFQTAAAAGLVYVTAWHSLITRGGLRPGETVLVVGSGGGVNSASIQIARLAGAKVYAVGSTAEKCRLAEELGADVTINREEEPDWSRALYKLTNKRGVDVVVDNVGAVTLNSSIRAATPGGRILVVGGTTGYKVEINVAQLFARQIAIIGSTMGPHQDFVTVMDLVFSGRLQAVVGEVLPLADIHRAMDMLENFEVAGKIVLDVT